MEKRRVLIITNEEDPHVDKLIPIIESRGGRCIRFNTENFPTGIDSSIKLNEALHCYLKIDGEIIDLRTIGAVWYRRSVDAKPDSRITEEHARNLVIRESREYIENLWFQINTLWVNHPYALRKASRKVEQLRVAKEIRWSIPPTLITNDEAEVKLFIKEHGEVIVKSLQAQFVETPESFISLFAHRLSEIDYNRIRDVKLGPCIFQKAIPKFKELRVTVIGDKVFSAELETQLLDQARDDWRRGEIQEIPCREIELHPIVKQKSLQIVERFGLRFATMDIIITPSGEHVFLDLNPNGQWLWVEVLTGIPMANAMADLLVNGVR